MDQVIALAQQLENTQTKEEEFLTLFTASKGVHNIFQIKDDDTVKSYWTKDLVSQFEYWKDRKNVFFTVNTARSWNRNKANTLQLNALVIDLDVYKVGMTKEQALFFLATTLKDNNIFQPTAVVDSGRGLYLYWKLTGQIANHKSLIALHEKITKVMQERLALLGADAASTDVLHLFRIPGTINHKENKERATVQVLEVNSDLIYDLQEFSDELLPVFKRKSGVIKTHFNKEKKRSVRHLYNGYTLALARAKDIEQLVQMRNYDLLGCRHRMLLYYACFLMQAHQDNYEQRVRDMNDSFLRPILMTLRTGATHQGMKR